LGVEDFSIQIVTLGVADDFAINVELVQMPRAVMQAFDRATTR